MVMLLVFNIIGIDKLLELIAKDKNEYDLMVD